jgi:hypothetical protein
MGSSHGCEGARGTRLNGLHRVLGRHAAAVHRGCTSSLQMILSMDL